MQTKARIRVQGNLERAVRVRRGGWSPFFLLLLSHHYLRQTTGFECSRQPATIVGTEGNDNILGTPNEDVIAALGGNDRVRALGGDDLVRGW
jgi:Ca2+-binding RTX toxin-like protein